MPAAPLLRIQPLASSHDRTKFRSGSDQLDRYFRDQASQDVKRRISTCFVAVDIGHETVVGFYTLAATSMALEGLAPEVAKKLPRYPVVPAAPLGRLAVSGEHQGQGIGAVLLSDALLRASRTDLGVFMMLVDAKDANAQAFYEKFGFRRVPGTERRLSLPIATAVQLLAERPM